MCNVCAWLDDPNKDEDSMEELLKDEEVVLCQQAVDRLELPVKEKGE